MPEPRRVDLALTYDAVYTNAPVGSCACFWLQGGAVQAAVPLWRFVSAVGMFSGEHSGNIPGFGYGLTLISGTGGIRLDHMYRTHYKPFAEALFGVVHAGDSYFPAPVKPSTSATAFNMIIGGGLDYTLTNHFAVRAIQADYHYMQLPNDANNEQHDLRLAAGVVYRF